MAGNPNTAAGLFQPTYKNLLSPSKPGEEDRYNQRKEAVLA